jgi:DNA helicase-2/ATP-dependent DNA helicase PcrA
MDHLEGLNPMQRKAASHMNGPLLIVAGAGAGKTKTITHRIVNLIKHGVAPEEILAVTFTNKAAKEMRERVIKEMEKSAPGQDRVPFISTFHSLGVYIIKENARALGLTKYFTILDDGDTSSMIKDILKDINLDPKQYDPKKIKGIISREKGKFTKLENYEERVNDPTDRGSYMGQIVARVWRMYEDKKAKENSLDFDDLLLKSVKLLKENEAIRTYYQDKWKYIHIDEYQDTNEVQYLMSKILAENNKNICVVGDADQNIYSWRGANLKNILSFEKDYKDATIVTLEENYRSTQNILEAANEVIKKNKFRPDKNLFTKNKIGEKIGLYEALDEGDEAEFVATKILEVIDRPADTNFPRVLGKNPQTSSESFIGGAYEGEIKDGIGNVFSSGDDAKQDIPRKNIADSVAVLYRANFQSRVFEEALLKYNIPYQVLGIKFFERKEIKDTLSYLRAALNRESLSDIKRIINFPARGIGKVTLAKIFAGEQASLPLKMQLKLQGFYETLEEIQNKIYSLKVSDVIKFVIKKTGIEQELLEGGDEGIERLENIKELATLALKYDNLTNGQGVEKLLEDASLASDQDSLMITSDKGGGVASAPNGVKLMTVHAAKGLEFQYVFIVGLEEGLFPHERMGDTRAGEDAEEERRLFYVALTRAREKLFLSFANFRTIFGSRQINAQSEFIADIPPDILEREHEYGVKTIYI